MLPCCLLLISAAINFVVNWEYFWVSWDVPLIPLPWCSNSTASSASSLLLSFLWVPLLYPSLSYLLSSSWGFSYPASPDNSHPWVAPPQAADSLHMRPHCGVLPSKAHKNKPMAVIFPAHLSCCSVSVVYWCSAAWLLCFLSHLFVAATLCIFLLSRTLPPRGCHHSHTCSSFSILTCAIAGSFLILPAPACLKLVCFKILKK